MLDSSQTPNYCYFYQSFYIKIYISPLLPGAFCDIYFDFGNSRAKEDFASFIAELFAEDIHVEFELKVLRPWNLPEELDNGFVVANSP